MQKLGSELWLLDPLIRYARTAEREDAEHYFTALKQRVKQRVEQRVEQRLATVML